MNTSVRIFRDIVPEKENVGIMFPSNAIKQPLEPQYQHTSIRDYNQALQDSIEIIKQYQDNDPIFSPVLSAIMNDISKLKK